MCKSSGILFQGFFLKKREETKAVKFYKQFVFKVVEKKKQQ